MAALTAKRRNKLPKASFGLPGQRAYPVDTPGRAIAAKGRAKTALEHGSISQSQFGQIIGKANKRLKKSK